MVCCSHAPQMPLAYTTANSHMRTDARPCPNKNPACSRISGRLNAPSQRCPRIQVCVRPMRQIGNFFRRLSRVTNAMKPKPTIPYARPSVVPPPTRGEPTAYGTYAASATMRIAALATAHDRWLRSMIIADPRPRASRLAPRTSRLRARPSFARCLGRTRPLPIFHRGHRPEERERLDAVRGVVRARIHAARLRMFHAQIATGRLLPGRRDHPVRLLRIGDLDLERVQVEVAVRTIPNAEAATDAPVLDDDLHRVAAPDRSHGAANHAERIAARATRGRDEVLVESQPFTNQTRHAVVRVRTRAHALIATRALLQVQQQETLRFHESLVQEGIDWDVLGGRDALPVLFRALARDLLEARADIRKPRHHQLEVFAGNLHDVDVIERGTRGRTHTAA